MAITKWAIDLDGVITGNPAALSWLTYHLLKNENNNEVYILTWRDGSNETRKEETIADLKLFGISYTKLVMAPERFLSMRTAAFWKISQVNELGINIWLDDELKNYQRDLGIDLERLLPNIIKINI
jgi:hypothetical protein